MHTTRTLAIECAAMLTAIATALLAQTAGQSELRTWFPQQVGARWEYRHELRQNSMQPGSEVETTDERWRTTEEITRSTVTDLGTLLTIHAQALDIIPAAIAKDWPTPALDFHVFIRKDCVYVLDGPDVLDVPEGVGPTGELSQDLRARLVAGRVPADYCFPLVVGQSWGRVPTTSPALEDVWTVKDTRAVDPFAPDDGTTFHLSSYLGSGTLIERWYERGVGVVRQTVTHYGSYEEEVRELTRFSTAQR